MGGSCLPGLSSIPVILGGWGCQKVDRQEFLQIVYDILVNKYILVRNSFGLLGTIYRHT